MLPTTTQLHVPLPLRPNADDEGGSLFDGTTPPPDDGDRLSARDSAPPFVVCLVARACLAWMMKDWVFASAPRVLLVSFVFGCAAVWTGLSLTRTRPVGFFGGTWWQTMRPLHAVLYTAAGALALTPTGRQWAWTPLAADAAIGAFAWARHYLQ